MSSPADIIRQLLIDLNLATEGLTSSWPVFVSFLPGTPDNALGIYDTAGKLDGRIMQSGEQVAHPGIQVVVRGSIYPDARKKAEDIAVALDAQIRTIVVMDSMDSYILHNVSRSGDIIPLGVEQEGDRRRHLLSINAVVTINQIE